MRARKSGASPRSVRVSRKPITLPTYLPLAPDKNPMFLEKRVYQGSSGKVYPLPFIDRIADEKIDRAWDAVILENEFIQVMILPEIGGRIHAGCDKTNGYDFFYRQDVIKPALVGLAGPWISGGVEFNWPQHHRPSTFMPADAEIEEHDDGSKTVWLSEHEPMTRMKGMHGVCIHPGKSLIEIKARVYNRTELPQTFLWWANVATRVHEQYQSFFPPDVSFVADHAKRAMSAFPLCRETYYGVDYAARAKRAGNDLSWYANIPVPTSYMAMGSQEDFFGGYDHACEAGLVHVASRHIAPGKKQWTWGNHEFGHAWARNLTDSGGPYIELMAGVYTDNQPDFSWLMPGETKVWSQFWYPISKIGVPQKANADAALSLQIKKSAAQVGVAVTSEFRGARIFLGGTAVPLSRTFPGAPIAEWTADLFPASPFLKSIELRQPAQNLTLRVTAAGGREIISYTPAKKKETEVPSPATEPPLPHEIKSSDELYLTGLHLEQYRHATRHPEDYWREGYHRDADDSRCHLALGRWHLRRGEFTKAEAHLRAAIKRLTARNPNPYDGEPFHQLGLALRHQGRDREAYDAFYKATWNYAWQSASYHALAELDCREAAWTKALEHVERSLRANADNLRARDLLAIVLRKLGRDREAERVLRETLALDPLDWWARHLLGQKLKCDTQVRLDLALDFSRAGFFEEALNVMSEASADSGTAPLIEYYRGWLHAQRGDEHEALAHFVNAEHAPTDYCFPARVEEVAILQSAISANPKAARARYYLGNLFYDRRRHGEAIGLWQKSANLDPAFPTVWRNLGIGYFNIAKKPGKARAAYDKAFRANPGDARVFFERDQLWKRLGENPSRRLREMEMHRELVERRDDLSVELCALFNQTGRHRDALAILSMRKFQPWEGGEGQALGQHVRTHLALGRAALTGGDAQGAVDHFQIALTSPHNLGEAKHLLANQSDIHYWLGEAFAALGDLANAETHWTTAATFRGDFQSMKLKAFSEMTYYSALSLLRLGRKSAAKKLLRDLLHYAKALRRAKAKIDYFATSLPTMLVFDDDEQKRQEITATFLLAQAHLGLGKKGEARKLLKRVLKADPNHPLAADLTADLFIK